MKSCCKKYYNHEEYKSLKSQYEKEKLKNDKLIKYIESILETQKEILEYIEKQKKD